MTPELEKFISLATRPLEKRPERRDEARGELMGRLSHQGVPVEQIDVSGPTARLEAAKPFPAKWRRGWVLGALFLLLGLFLLGLWRDGWMLYRSIIAQQLVWQTRYTGSAPPGQPDPFHGWLDRKAPEMPIRGRAGEIEALRRDNPGDLAILQETLLRRSITENTFMTEAERGQIARLDPDNALWPMLEMSWEFHKAEGSEPFGGYYFGRSGTGGDPTAVKRAWQRFDEAVQLDRFRSHGRELVQRQCDAYGAERSVLDGLILQGLAELPRSATSRTFFYYGSGMSPFSTAMAGRASTLAKPGRGDELIGFFDDWKKLHRLVVGSETPDPWALANFTEAAAETGKTFVAEFTALGMKEPADEAREIARKAASPTRSFVRRARSEAGMRLQSGSMPDDFSITSEEMRPGRKADMAMFHRMFAWPLAAFALLFVLMWGFEACRRSPEVKGMARGLMPLLTRRDHLSIGFFGIVVPWLYWWGVTRLTPVGISDRIFGDDEWVALAWALQVVLGLVLGLVMLTQSVRGRWARRGGFLGLAGRMPWLGRAVAWLVALSLPAAGLIRFLDLANDDEKGYYLLGCAAAGSIGLLWLLWVGIMNLCTPRHGALGPNLVARTMIPWTLAGLATLLLAAGVLRFAESWWYRRDPLLPAWTSEHYTNALEERMVMERVGRLREAFGVAPSGEP